MNEYQATIEYIRTIKQVFREKGLAKAVRHELISFFGSLFSRVTRANAYLVSILDLAGDPIALSEVLQYNREIRKGRISNLLNPNLSEDGWKPANWVEVYC